METAAHEAKRVAIHNKITSLTRLASDLNYKASSMLVAGKREDAVASYKEAMTKIRETLDERDKCIRELYELEHTDNQSSASGSGLTSHNIHCPVADCRGFADSKWDCGVCGVAICPDCHSLKETDHVCSSDTLKTIQLLEQDTKQCPKCNTMIHKINGCDQMWCTVCRTAFSWTTGEIEGGVIHNPHYYLWRNGGGIQQRNPGDEACGGVPNRTRLIDNISIIKAFVGVPVQASATETEIRNAIQREMELDNLAAIIAGLCSRTEMWQRCLDENRRELMRREEMLREFRIRFINKTIRDEETYVKVLCKFLNTSAYAAELVTLFEFMTASVTERLHQIDLLTHEFANEKASDGQSFYAKALLLSHLLLNDPKNPENTIALVKAKTDTEWLDKANRIQELQSKCQSVLDEIEQLFSYFDNIGKTIDANYSTNVTSMVTPYSGSQPKHLQLNFNHTNQAYVCPFMLQMKTKNNETHLRHLASGNLWHEVDVEVENRLYLEFAET